MASAETLRHRVTTTQAAEKISDEPSSDNPTEETTLDWWQQFLLNWIYTGGFITFVHVAALIGCMMYRSPKTETLWLTYAMFQLATLGVTMGYHRLFSHKAYTASEPLRILLMFMGTMALQKSVRWWTIMHRLHHRFTDDEANDPYAATKGFYYSHIGWFFQTAEYPKKHVIETDDLDSDPLIVLQDKYYEPLALFTSFVLPTLLGFLWGDALGSLIYAGFLAHVFIWHVTWFINSLAHWAGDMPFATSAESTARGHFLLLAVLTNGEGYHNFHHEFPYDYRNGIDAMDWDPSKWLIWGCSKIGLASGLKRASEEDINHAMVHSRNYALAASKGLAMAPDRHQHEVPNLSTMPTFTKSQLSASPRTLMVIDGLVVDATDYKEGHPGGARFLNRYKGLDATKAFHGGINKHTFSARGAMARLVVGKMVEE